MVMEKLIKEISELTKSEERLFYWLPKEIEKNIRDNQIVFYEEDGELAAFCLWNFYGGWVEIHTVFVAPRFRGRGYLRRIFNDVTASLEKRLHEIRGIFFFTRVPAMRHVAQEYGFKTVSYWRLPFGVWLKIIQTRLNPRKLSSHFKHGSEILASLVSPLFVRQT